MAHERAHPATRARSAEVKSSTDWRASVWAGLIAGAVFMMLEMVMVWLFTGQSPWGPPRMMAAMLMGLEVLQPPPTLAMMPMKVAMMIHFPLSVVYGLVIGWMVHRMDMGMAVLAGAAFGLIASDAAQAGPPPTPVSSHDAKVVAAKLLGGDHRSPDYSIVPSVAFTIPPIAAVGL